jgi:hypothetical protein
MSNRNRDEWDHPYADVDAPAFMGPDGTFSNATTYRDMLAYAPFGKGNLGHYWREVLANVVLKEGLAVLFVSFLLPGIVATAPGPDAVSRAIFVGLIAGLSIFAMLNWGYNDRLPRHMTAGATVVEFLSGNINWFLMLLYLAVGVLFSVVGASILYSTGTSAIPIIGNHQWAGTVFVIQFFFTTAIALTVLDQFTTRRGKPRVFKQRSETPSTEIAPFRAYQEDLGARPYVYGAIAYLKWGLWSFNSYTYFAGALGLQFLGCGVNSWNNVDCVNSTGSYVAGAAALFILTDIAAWIFAAFLNAVLYWLHNNEPRLEEDDSSYGHKSRSDMNSRVDSDVNLDMSNTRKPSAPSAPKKNGRKRITSNNSPSIQSRLNLDPKAWTGEK